MLDISKIFHILKVVMSNTYFHLIAKHFSQGQNVPLINTTLVETIYSNWYIIEFIIVIIQSIYKKDDKNDNAGCSLDMYMDPMYYLPSGFMIIDLLISQSTYYWDFTIWSPIVRISITVVISGNYLNSVKWFWN